MQNNQSIMQISENKDGSAKVLFRIRKAEMTDVDEIMAVMHEAKNDKEHPFIFDKVIHTKRFSGPYFNRMVEDQNITLAYGYFCEEGGTLYHDDTFGYDFLDMEYYDGELENEKRV